VHDPEFKPHYHQKKGGGCWQRSMGPFLLLRVVGVRSGEVDCWLPRTGAERWVGSAGKARACFLVRASSGTVAGWWLLAVILRDKASGAAWTIGLNFRVLLLLSSAVLSLHQAGEGQRGLCEGWE
jgi:hypothetical protein